MKTSDKVIRFQANSSKAGEANDNISTFAGRIRYFRMLNNMSQVHLSEMLGITKNTISNWESGRRRPELDMVPALCAALGITFDEFYGSGECITSEDKKFILRYHSLNPSNRELTSKMVDTMLEMQANEWRKSVLANNRRIFWNESKTAAGTGTPLTDRAQGHYVYLHIDDDVRRADEIITVSGDSMEPTFRDGDALLVERTEIIKPGEIGIFVADGEGFVKEYQLDGLHSHNPAYSVLKFSDDDNVRCFGRVLRALETDEFASAEELEVLTESCRHQ